MEGQRSSVGGQVEQEVVEEGEGWVGIVGGRVGTGVGLRFDGPGLWGLCCTLQGARR